MNQWNTLARDADTIRGRLKCTSSEGVLIKGKALLQTYSSLRLTMRKIETQMNSAIRSRRDWHSGNTRVEITEDNTAFVYLHGNKIAEVDETNVRLFDGGGYQTVTTKSRLNAICYEFLSPFFGVFQKNWNWFVNVQLDRTNPVPFYSGIALDV